MTGVHTRVTVVNDHELFASAMTIALTDRGFTATSVVPHCGRRGTVSDLVRLIAGRHPEIVLLGVELGNGRDGIELVAPLARLGITVVVISERLDGVRAGHALSLGATHAFSSSTPLADVVRVIERLARRLPSSTHVDAGRLPQAWTAQSASERELQARLDCLTPTEADILGHLMQGQRVREIARVRFVSESTVRTHVKAILAKLQVKSQLTAVGLANRLGWQPPGDSSDYRGRSAVSGSASRSGHAS